MTTAALFEIMREWFSHLEPTWKNLGASATLLIPDRADIEKAAVNLETPRYLCSITVWALGTIEFIVMDRALAKEVVMRDLEYTSDADLRTKLDECAAEFVRLNEGDR